MYLLNIQHFFLNCSFLHFNKHSLDGATITAEQFAKILLSHTNYDRDEVVKRLSRDPPVAVKVQNCPCSIMKFKVVFVVGYYVQAV